MKNIEIYTDGACSGNPGKGGWGAVLINGSKQKELAGYHPQTTNNIMEMTAVVMALEALKEPCKVNLYSDSAYVVNAFNLGWLAKWQSNGWKAASGPVKNKEIWQKLLELTNVHDVTFIKVKGHSDNELNNRCDFLATEQIKINS